MFSKKAVSSLLAAACIFITGSVEAENVSIAPTNENIQYFGRWSNTSGNYSCGYGATYIKANFYGTAIKAYTEGDHSWWSYSIDNGPYFMFRVEDGITVLAENLSEGPHKVKLVRATEGEAGISVFKGFELNEGGYMLEPDPVKARRLEFVGDSISAGACNAGPMEAGWYDKEDNNMAFGPKLARMLNADYSVVARSGEGVIHNYGENPPYDGVHTIDRYAWINYSFDKYGDHELWDTAKFPVDGVIVALGTNDFAEVNVKPEEDEFVDGYYKLIQKIRGMNPNAKIICTEPVPTIISIDAGIWVKEAVEMANNNGDSKVYYIALNEEAPLLRPEDYVGDETHPTQDGSTKIASYLKDRVANILGWQ